jgi:hypothetical protein
MSWLRRTFDRMRWDGTIGRPRSANAASSFHLVWEAPPSAPWIAAEATLEVATPPMVDALYFWALQVSFADRGRIVGGAHLGLQWYAIHPGSTAVNWGGYAADGRELTGSESSLPSAPSNPNTRDFPWLPSVRYRLRIELVPDVGAQPSPVQAWRGGVTDLDSGRTTVVRDLFAPGSTIEAPMVWSEVFADCNAPTTAVRWSELRLQSADGSSVTVATVRTNYQAVLDGGCSNTNSASVADGFEQVTSVPRTTPAGSRLTLD